MEIFVGLKNSVYLCIVIESTRNTKLKIKLRDIANVFSGVYA